MRALCQRLPRPYEGLPFQLKLATRQHGSFDARVGPAAIPTAGISYYWDTKPPTGSQLQYADKFFKMAPPRLIDSATHFRTVKETSMPEVAFLGRSNVGKSSLLNALMGKDLCHTSKHPGRTRSMNFFAIGGQDPGGNPGRLALLDMPGYGKGSHAEWGPEVVKYLTGRKQLRRAFVLVDPSHGLKSTDEQLLALLRENGVAHQVLFSKVDRVLSPKRKFSPERMEKNRAVLTEVCANLRAQIQPGVGDGPEALGEVICCSTEARIDGQKLGVADLRWAVLAATGITSARKLPSSVTLSPDLQ